MVQMCGTTGEPFHRMLKQFRLLTRPTLARRDAPCPKQGRSERRPEAYPLGYVEGLNDARTKLADCFSILLAANKGDEFLVHHIRSFPLRDVPCIGDSGKS
jgi:hypothetical protein